MMNAETKPPSTPECCYLHVLGSALDLLGFFHEGKASVAVMETTLQNLRTSTDNLRGRPLKTMPWLLDVMTDVSEHLHAYLKEHERVQRTRWN